MINARGLMTNLRLVGLLAVLTGIFIGAGRLIGGTGGMIIAFGLAAVMNFVSFWYSDKIVLKIYGAEEIPEESNPELHETVAKLSENAGIPKPRLYMSSMKAPNAFATGRSPKKGVVCVTDGLMSQLDDDEVAGVIAHELAHIKNRDTLTNAAVTVLAGAISILAEMAFWGAMLGRGNERGADMAGGLAIMILTPLIASLIRFAISRSMEFRADSGAVRIQGEKQALSSALKKISSANERTHIKGSRVQEAGSNMFISNPFTGHKITRFFSTHPPLEKRLNNIESTEI